eukprot:m51a1_g6619 hypothetical protein (365) ;mRNA; f:43417-44576
MLLSALLRMWVWVVPVLALPVCALSLGHTAALRLSLALSMFHALASSLRGLPKALGYPRAQATYDSMSVLLESSALALFASSAIARSGAPGLLGSAYAVVVEWAGPAFYLFEALQVARVCAYAGRTLRATAAVEDASTARSLVAAVVGACFAVALWLASSVYAVEGCANPALTTACGAALVLCAGVAFVSTQREKGLVSPALMSLYVGFVLWQAPKSAAPAGSEQASRVLGTISRLVGMGPVTPLVKPQHAPPTFSGIRAVLQIIVACCAVMVSKRRIHEDPFAVEVSEEEIDDEAEGHLEGGALKHAAMSAAFSASIVIAYTHVVLASLGYVTDSFQIVMRVVQAATPIALCAYDLTREDDAW